VLRAGWVMRGGDDVYAVLHAFPALCFYRDEARP
jgi:hypothetical protein